MADPVVPPPATPAPSSGTPLVLVVDFGAQYAQLIARRVRDAHVYSELVPHTASAAEILRRSPAAIILSGGPESVYEPGAPEFDPQLLRSGVPVLGICYGFQAMAQALDGVVEQTTAPEFGRTKVSLEPASVLFHDVDASPSVWMSHRDAVVEAPPGFRATAGSAGATVAAFEDPDAQMFGVQWHPEVAHSEFGQKVIENFLYEGAGITPEWTIDNIVTDAIAGIRSTVGDHHLICGLSGGVDSAVAATLVHEAVGDQLTCVFVDHGLLRKGEAQQVERDFVEATGIRLKVKKAAEEFLAVLDGVTDPEDKRRAIGAQFIRTFEEASTEAIEEHGAVGDVEFLVQGTLYPDVVESGGGTGTKSIKSHHNVGGLPEDLRFELIEPLRSLFKDEVRAVGESLGLPKQMVWRHPFPGPGLAIRIIGAVTEENLAILREADAIAQEELAGWPDDQNVWQFPVVLLADIRTVGVQGDNRSYGHPVVLRPVTSEDAMTADWSRLPYDLIERISTRITNEIVEINRVVLDVTSKPPGTIEWE